MAWLKATRASSGYGTIAGIRMKIEKEDETREAMSPSKPERRRYRLEELLEECEPGPISNEDREWLEMRMVGREIET
jgi:hypothetical protein